MQTKFAKRIAVLNQNAQQLENSQELRALTIAYLTDLQEAGTELTPEQENDLQLAIRARIQFLKDGAENRTSEEKTQLLDAIRLRMGDLNSIASGSSARDPQDETEFLIAAQQALLASREKRIATMFILSPS